MLERPNAVLRVVNMESTTAHKVKQTHDIRASHYIKYINPYPSFNARVNFRRDLRVRFCSKSFRWLNTRLQGQEVGREQRIVLRLVTPNVLGSHLHMPLLQLGTSWSKTANIK